MNAIMQWLRQNRIMIMVVLVTIVTVVLMGVQIVRLGAQSAPNVVGTQVPTTNTGTDVWFWICAIIVLIGAAAAIFGRGGAPALWALGVLAIAAGAVLLSGMLFGDSAPEVRRAFQTGMAQSVLNQQRTAPQVAVPPVREQAVVPISLHAGETHEERVYSNQCIIWQTGNPHRNDDLTVKVRGANNNVLVPYPAFLEMRRNGKVDYGAAWYHFTANEDVVLMIRIGPRTLCHDK